MFLPPRCLDGPTDAILSGPVLIDTSNAYRRDLFKEISSMNTFSRRPWLKVAGAGCAMMVVLFGVHAYGQAAGSNDCDLKFEKKLSLTAQYENNLPKDLVAGTGTQTSVKMYRGVPTLHVNDRPVYAMLMIPSCYTWDGKNEEMGNIDYGPVPPAPYSPQGMGKRSEADVHSTLMKNS
jgi:hypothetical protein